jgi:hypothetical protein
LPTTQEPLKIYGLALYGRRIEDGRIIIFEEGMLLEDDGNLEEEGSNQNPSRGSKKVKIAKKA